MLLPAVFILSLSSLTFEILLTRIFAISQWNHLSFMVISIALFGFAASGTALNIHLNRKGFEKYPSTQYTINTCLVLYTVSLLAALPAVNGLPLDFFRLPMEVIQGFYLLLMYLLLMLPFFFTGWLLSLSYALLPEKSGLIYFSSMAGSALGAVLPVILISVLNEIQIILLTGLLPPAAVIYNEWVAKGTASTTGKMGFFTSKMYLCTGIGLVVILGTGLTATSIVSIKPFPYKALSQILLFPDTVIEHSHRDLRGRIDSVKSPFLRYAPGLSINYMEGLPVQQAAFTDGDDQFVLYDLDKKETAQFSRSILSYAGYLLHPSVKKVLIVQKNGGTAIPCAVSSGAKEITITEENPYMADLIERHYGFPVIHHNERQFLSASKEQFDIIHIDNWGYSLPGSAALNQEYVFTIQAFERYLRHLHSKGVLIISRKLLLPPTDCLRLWATAYESLRAMGKKNPESHIAVLRNWDTFTLLVSAGPISDKEKITQFAGKLNFDLVFLSGLERDLANRYNVFNRPYHFDEIGKLAAAYRLGLESEYFRAYAFDVSPQTDQRPFPNRFFKWSRMAEIYHSMGSRFYTLLLSGEVIISAVFMEALVLSLLLLMAPLFFIKRKKQNRLPAVLLYFAGTGAGFIFVELYLIKQFTGIFEGPTISFTVVLTGILIFSGLGGILSSRLSRKSITSVILPLIFLQILLGFTSPVIFSQIIKWPAVFQYVSSISLLIAMGILMGMPFPLGMMFLSESPVSRIYAWTANGCASVVTAVIAEQEAISLGIPSLILCAAVMYFLAIVGSLSKPG